LTVTKEKRKKPELSPAKYRQQLDRKKETGYALPSLAELSKKKRKGKRAHQRAYRKRVKQRGW
jgi:hypothetical protein